MEHKFQINLRGIIDLLSEHLYSGPEVYVRELLQNAVDAITARTKAEPGFAGEVAIECHAPKGKPPAVVFTDNGIGLTADEVHKFLATIGLSSKRLADGTRPADFIGQFGIGILSCLVVSEEIVVITRSAADPTAKPVEWRAKSDGTYTLKDIDRELEPGTQVWLTAKPGSEELYAADAVRRLAKHYGGMLPYPIRVTSGRSQQVVNADGPPWRRKYPSDKERSRALLAYGAEVFDTKFFDAVPLASKAGGVEGVAFVLSQAPGANARHLHRVYLKNMFLSDTADNLLPEWAFFVRAVVNADSLRPTASRETFYEDATLERARDALGQCLRQYLVDLAESRPEKLERFVNLHHRSLKALASEDEEFYRVIIDHLPFETSMGPVTFGEYRKQFDRIRYVADVDSFRQVSGVATAQGICIINAGYAYDGELLARASEVFPELNVEAVDPAALAQGFEDPAEADQDSADALVNVADRVLKAFHCRADARRFEPENVPVLYTTSREGRFFRSLEQSKEQASPLWSGVLDNLGKSSRMEESAVLTFNFRNALVRKLSAMRDREKITRAIQMLYVQALLLGHHPLSSREMAILNEGILGLIEAAT